MPFIAGGFSKFRNKQQVNSINKSEEPPECRTAASVLDKEEKNDHIAGLTDFQAESMKNEALNTNSPNDNHNQNEKCEFQLMQTEESLMYLNPETFLYCHDSFTWKIVNFLKLPMDEDYFIDSREFSFANAIWCLRMYPNGKKGNHEGWVHLLLVQLQSSHSRHQISYKLRLKVNDKDKDLYNSLTHVITLHDDMAEVGIVTPLHRSVFSKRLTSYGRNSFLVAICEIEIVKLSKSQKACEASSSHQTEELAKHNQKLCLPLTLEDYFVWETKKVFELPMNESYFIDSEKFSIANAEWCLRMYPNGQKNLSPGWIHLLLIRLNPSSSQQCIQYKLGLEMPGLKKMKCRKVETLNHLVTFHASDEEAGVLNLIKRSDIISVKKNFPQNGILRVICQVKIPTVDVTNKATQLELPSNFPLNDVELYGPSLFQHGMLFQKSFLATTEIMWKIPDFVELRKSAVDSINSPVFEFGSDTWLLQLYPNGSKNSPLGISFVISRLFTAVMKQHIICHFSIRDSANIISRCKLEDVFEGSSKSHPVHLELPEVLNNPNAIVPDGILTVFCQIYIVSESEATGHLQPITKSSSNARNRLRYGLLSQQSFSAVTDITWEIPNFFTLENYCYYINSPVFNLAGETCLLQLYPNGYETSEENISLVLVRLFPSDINHHIICKFNVKSTNKVVDGKGSCEKIFKKKILKSSLTHLKKVERKQEEENPNDLLTVYCQMYVIEDKKSILVTSSESAQSKETDTFSLHDMKKYVHGTLVQQLFLAATEVIWKIPDFLKQINKSYIDSPVFGLADDTWFLRLYLRGNERKMKRCYCVLIRSFPSSLERHVIWKISIKNKKNMVIESSTCESTYRNRIQRSCPIHMEPSKIINNMRENLPQDVLMLFCQMYITDDNRETVMKSSSQINQPNSITSEDLCVGDTVIVKEKENKSHFSEGFQDSQENEITEEVIIDQKFDHNIIGDKGEEIMEIKDKFNQGNITFPEPGLQSDKVVIRGPKQDVEACHKYLQCMPEELKINNISVDVPIYKQNHKFIIGKRGANIKKIREETNTKIDLPDEGTESDVITIKGRKEDVLLARNKILAIQEELDLISKDGGGTVLDDGKDNDMYWVELDFTQLKKERSEKKNVIMNQFVTEHPLPEQKNEANIARNDLCIEDMVVLKEDENKSYFSEGFQNSSQDTIVKDDEYASVNTFKVFDADLNTLTDDGKINSSQLDVRYPDKEIKDAVELEKDAVAKIHQESKNISLCEKAYVKFLVRGEEIQAHLSAFKDQSNTFASVIQLDVMNLSSMVIIEDSDPHIFKTFLQYLYTGQVDVLTSKNMFELYSIANKYGVHKLKIECLEYMKNTLSVDTVCNIMAFSFQHKENEILELTTSFFLNNATEITSTAKWQTFLKENYMLASDLVEKVLKN